MAVYIPEMTKEQSEEVSRAAAIAYEEVAAQIPISTPNGWMFKLKTTKKRKGVA